MLQNENSTLQMYSEKTYLKKMQKHFHDIMLGFLEGIFWQMLLKAPKAVKNNFHFNYQC